MKSDSDRLTDVPEVDTFPRLTMPEDARLTESDLILTLHTCDVCGARTPWSDSWSRYGSIISEEMAGRLGIWLVCSDTCKAAFPPAEIEKKIITRCGFNPFSSRMWRVVGMG